MSASEQAHGAVHLREQPRDRGLARSGIAEEDEVLRGGDLREPVPLSLCLDLQERHQGAHLFLHRLEPDQRIELGLELRHRPGRLGPSELIGDPVGRVRGSCRLGQTLAQHSQAAGHVLERIPRHAAILTTRRRDSPQVRER